MVGYFDGIDGERADQRIDEPVAGGRPGAAGIEASKHAVPGRAHVHDIGVHRVHGERGDDEVGESDIDRGPALAAVDALEHTLARHAGVERGGNARIEYESLHPTPGQMHNGTLIAVLRL